MKRFKLQCGTVIKVDDCDAYLLRSYVWRSRALPDGRLEILRGRTGESHNNFLGHYIMGASGDQFVTFLNGDSTDLRRENMRVVSRKDFFKEIGALRRSPGNLRSAASEAS